MQKNIDWSCQNQLASAVAIQQCRFSPGWEAFPPHTLEESILSKDFPKIIIKWPWPKSEAIIALLLRKQRNIVQWCVDVEQKVVLTPKKCNPPSELLESIACWSRLPLPLPPSLHLFTMPFAALRNNKPYNSARPRSREQKHVAFGCCSSVHFSELRAGTHEHWVKEKGCCCNRANKI